MEYSTQFSGEISRRINEYYNEFITYEYVIRELFETTILDIWQGIMVRYWIKTFYDVTTKSEAIMGFININYINSQPENYVLESIKCMMKLD